MKNRVITISREFGSGGRTIERAVDSPAFPIACRKMKQALFTQARMIMQR